MPLATLYWLPMDPRRRSDRGGGAAAASVAMGDPFGPILPYSCRPSWRGPAREEPEDRYAALSQTLAHPDSFGRRVARTFMGCVLEKGSGSRPSTLRDRVPNLTRGTPSLRIETTYGVVYGSTGTPFGPMTLQPLTLLRPPSDMVSMFSDAQWPSSDGMAPARGTVHAGLAITAWRAACEQGPARLCPS